MLRTACALAFAAPAAAWWKDEATRTRGAAPYPYPATNKDGTAPEYKVVNEKTGINPNKINVHLVPHTHDDTGWQVTVDQYFFTEVYYVVDTVVDQLVKNPQRHFIYVETGFFARWWDEQDDARRNLTRSLVANGPWTLCLTVLRATAPPSVILLLPHRTARVHQRGLVYARRGFALLRRDG
jgi:hypothetical protein